MGLWRLGISVVRLMGIRASAFHLSRGQRAAMILDQLSRRKWYQGLHPRLVRALEYLATTDLTSLSEGKHTIEGEQLFAIVQDYQPKPVEMGAFESHRRYWDVQYVVRGAERMGWAPVESLRVVQPHDDERDIAFFDGVGPLFTVESGWFAIFAPHDGHMPSLALENPPIGDLGMVRKVVVKVECLDT